LLIGYLREVAIPEADGFEICGREQADQVVRFGAEEIYSLG
jgi:hypothetical protein